MIMREGDGQSFAPEFVLLTCTLRRCAPWWFRRPNDMLLLLQLEEKI